MCLVPKMNAILFGNYFECIALEVRVKEDFKLLPNQILAQYLQNWPDCTLLFALKFSLL